MTAPAVGQGASRGARSPAARARPRRVLETRRWKRDKRHVERPPRTQRRVARRRRSATGGGERRSASRGASNGRRQRRKKKKTSRTTPVVQKRIPASYRSSPQSSARRGRCPFESDPGQPTTTRSFSNGKTCRMGAATTASKEEKTSQGSSTEELPHASPACLEYRMARIGNTCAPGALRTQFVRLSSAESEKHASAPASDSDDDEVRFRARDVGTRTIRFD